MKPDDLIEVVCPDCGGKREIKWSAFKNKKKQQKIGPPYYQKDRACSNKRKMSEEQKKKISEKLTGRTISQETKVKIQAYRKAHPELWTTLQPELGRGKRFRPHSEQTKLKISQAMKKKPEKDKNNE